jgi:splicing factor 3B subunit 4
VNQKSDPNLGFVFIGSNDEKNSQKATNHATSPSQKLFCVSLLDRLDQLKILMSAAIEQRNQDATCYVGNLDEKVHEELLWELMLQVGPVINVHMPKDKVTGKLLGYGFVEYRSEEDADYAIKTLNMIKLYNKPIKVNKASQDKKQMEVGANIFIGNLDPDVDEKLLYDTFSAFGGITQTPKILCDSDSGSSKGYGFVSFDSFEASDLAIECMNGQYLSNRPIVVQYAFKKDTPGERHGSQAERILAASQPQRLKPNTHFSSGMGDVGQGMTAIVGSNVNQMLAFQHQQQLEMQQQMLTMQQMQQQQFNPMMMMQHAAAMHNPFGQLPMSMQAPMAMMPQAPGSLPAYMYGQPPPPPPMGGPSIMGHMLPPPPPPMQQYSQPPPPPQFLQHQPPSGHGMPPPPPPPVA